MSVLLLIALVLLEGVAGQFGAWRDGRASFYGKCALIGPACPVLATLALLITILPYHHWSIHKGSCGYGWLDKSIMTGERSCALRIHSVHPS